MGLTVRGLLPFVRQYRPDVLEAQCIFPIEETVRRICNYTQLAQETFTVPVLAGTSVSPVVSPSGDEVERVVRVMTPNVPSTAQYPSTFLGFWDATNGGPGESAFTITVTPVNQQVTFNPTTGAETSSPIVLNVTITRSTGFTKPINVWLPYPVLGWGTGSSVVVSGGTIRMEQPGLPPYLPGGSNIPQLLPGGSDTVWLDNVPNSFTITFSGPRSGWVGATLDPTYGGLGRTNIYGVSSDSFASATSNSFEVTAGSPYYFLVFKPRDVEGGWEMPKVAWTGDGNTYDPQVGTGRTPFGIRCEVHRVNGHSSAITLSIPAFDGNFDGTTNVTVNGDVPSQASLQAGYSFVSHAADSQLYDIDINCSSSSGWPLGSSWESAPGKYISGTDGLDAVKSNSITVNIAS